MDFPEITGPGAGLESAEEAGAVIGVEQRAAKGHPELGCCDRHLVEELQQFEVALDRSDPRRVQEQHHLRGDVMALAQRVGGVAQDNAGGEVMQSGGQPWPLRRQGGDGEGILAENRAGLTQKVEDGGALLRLFEPLMDVGSGEKHHKRQLPQITAGQPGAAAAIGMQQQHQFRPEAGHRGFQRSRIEAGFQHLHPMPELLQPLLKTAGADPVAGNPGLLGRQDQQSHRRSAKVISSIPRRLISRAASGAVRARSSVSRAGPPKASCWSM